jgi:hypothetical protein
MALSPSTTALHDEVRLAEKWRTYQEGNVRISGQGARQHKPSHNPPMNMPTALYRRHRFPPEIISHCVWLYPSTAAQGIEQPCRELTPADQSAGEGHETV